VSRTTITKAVCLALLGGAFAASVALAATVVGTPRDDRLVGTAAADTMFGLRGDDLIRGLEGDDTLYGDGSCPPGAADPVYCSTGEGPADGDDTLRGGPGDDKLLGQGGRDSIRGGSGNDTINGGSGSDRLFGGAGNDVIYAQDGARDAVSCGPGTDRVIADEIDAIDRDCESSSARAARRLQ